MVRKEGSFSFFFRMALREGKKNWPQFLALVLIGAVATTLFVGLKANAQSLAERVEETYRNGNMADLWVTSSRYDRKESEGIHDLLQEGEGIEGRFEMTAGLGSHSVLTAISEKLPSISAPFDLRADPDAKEGEFFILDEALSKDALGADAGGNFYALGDAVLLNYDLSGFSSVFESLSEALGFDRYFEDDLNPFLHPKWSFSFVVTGFMKHPENITKSSYGVSTLLLSDALAKKAMDDYFYARLKTGLSEEEQRKALQNLSEIFAELGYFEESEGRYRFAPNQWLIKTGDPTRTKALEGDLKKLSEREGSAIRSVNDRETMPFFLTVSNEIEQAHNFTYLFPAVFFFVAVLIILVTTSAMIARERIQIGTLKAIGVGKGGILSFYVSIILGLSFVGFLLGLIVGPLLIPWIMDNKYAIIYTLPSLHYVFPWWEALLAGLLFLGLSALTAYLSVRKAADLSPAESLRPAERKIHSLFKGAKKKEARSEPAWWLSLKMAFRNIRLSLAKSAMVVVGVMGCTALLVTGFGIEDTVYYGINRDLDYAITTDLTLGFHGELSEEEIRSSFKDYSFAEDLEPYSLTSETLASPRGERKTANLYIVTGAEKTHFGYAKDLKKGEVAIAKKTAEELSVGAGDVLSFTYGNLSYEAPIAYVYESFAFNGAVLYSQSPFFEDVPLAYGSAYLDVDGSISPEEARDKLLEEEPTLKSVLTKSDWEKRISEVLDGILLMTLALKIFAILLALVVLYNLALLSYNERHRDIATLKVLGFRQGEIVLSLLFETLSLTLVGVLFGMALGYPFLLATLGLNKVELVSYLYHIESLSYFFAFALTFLVALLVNLFFGLRSRSIRMVESLKSVE